MNFFGVKINRQESHIYQVRGCGDGRCMSGDTRDLGFVVWNRTTILDRAFDVWSPHNETFYNQFSNALYSNGEASVQDVLEQYDVQYVLLDESVIAPGQDKAILRIDETKKIAQELGWKETFHEGFLTVWDTGVETGEQFVSAPSSYTWVDADTSKVREDVTYAEEGTYISANQRISESAIAYPFVNLMREEVKEVEYGENGLQLTAYGVQQGQELIIPGWKVGDIVRINVDGDMPLPAYRVNGVDGAKCVGEIEREGGVSYVTARVGEGKEWVEYLQDSRFENQDSKIEIEVTGAPFVYDFATAGQSTIGNCDVLKRGVVEKRGVSTSRMNEALCVIMF